MNTFVVDTSVAAKWFFPEGHSEQASGLLDDRNTLYAPDYLLLELASVVWQRIGRGEINSREGRSICTAIRHFPLGLHRFEPLLDSSFELAVHLRQTVYDCLFLALSLALEAPLMTADRRFHRAVQRTPLADQVLWIGDIGAASR